MQLLYQTHSPFARKALVFAHEAGLADQIKVIHHETSPTNRNDEVFALNPLGKVPILITDDGDEIFDSRVICRFLDDMNVGQKLIPTDFGKSIAALKLQSIADGMSEAGILVRWESTRRPEHLRHEGFYKGQLAKVMESFDYLERNIVFDGSISIGEIALATSLSWLDFRNVASFREHPKLMSWYEMFSDRQSMHLTKLVGDTKD